MWADLSPLIKSIQMSNNKPNTKKKIINIIKI